MKMKQIKKRNKFKIRRVTVNKILFWATVAYGIIISAFILINVFMNGTLTTKIVATALYAALTPLVVLYSIQVYTLECHEWRPFSD